MLQRKKKPLAADEVIAATALGVHLQRSTSNAAVHPPSAPHDCIGTARAGNGVVLGRAGIVPTATAIGTEPFVGMVDVEREIERVLGRLREDLSRAIKKLNDIESTRRQRARSVHPRAVRPAPARALVAAARARACAASRRNTPARLPKSPPMIIARQIEELRAVIG